MKSEYQKFISERISQIRIAKDLSSRDMSITLKKNQNYINQIENGKTNPSLNGLVKICDFFGLTLVEFLYEGNLNPWYIKEIVEMLEYLGEEYSIKLLESLKVLKEKI